ncbi:MAG: dual specificity protein phosphatase family protein [Alcanivoracaceae bacterium]|nr:dual specificity protein phosphatase family protein [Alcanivoracaceae bacterium]
MNNASFNADMVFLHKQWDKQVFRYNLDKGSIIMMPKPPGGEQLPHYIKYLHHRGINVLISLLQFEEVNAFSLINEGSECEKTAIEFINFQIKDHGVPQFFLPFNQLIEKLTTDISKGKNIAIHCYAGIGRTGLTSASILIKLGMQVDSALIGLSQSRGLKVPETIGQISWLHHHAQQLSTFQSGM